MTNGPLLTQLHTVWDALKNLFRMAMTLSDWSMLLKAVGNIGNEITYLVGVVFSLSEIYFLIKEKNLKFRQKIIPFLGSALACAFQLVILVILCAAIAVLLPPFFLVASALNVFRNIGFYVQERAERNNLRAFFKDEKAWYKEIEALNLTPRLRVDFKRLLHSDHFDKRAVYDLHVRLANHVVNQKTEDKEALSYLLGKLRKGAYLPDEKAELEKTIKFYQKKIEKEFKAHYEPLFKLLEKKQRLNYLERNVENRIKNVLLSMGLMLISAVVCVLTIAAPTVAPFVYGGLGAVGAVFSGASIAVSTQLWWRSSRGQKNVSNPQGKISEAIVPQVFVGITPKKKERIRRKLIFSAAPPPPPPSPEPPSSPSSSSRSQHSP